MAEIILAERTLAFGEENGVYGNSDKISDTPVELVAGETYTVVWDGTQYECVAEIVPFDDGNEVEIGNASITGIEDDTGEPFVFGYDPDTQFNLLYTTSEGETHTLVIYKGTMEESTNEKLPEQTLGFIKNSQDDIHCANINTDDPEFLVAGNAYTVVWDDTEYVCTAENVTLEGIDAVGIGNLSIEGAGDNTGEPFCIGYASAYAMVLFSTLETAASHKVAIYNGDITGGGEEEPDIPDVPTETKGANIVLYDRNGNPVTYEGIETVTFNTDKDGQTATYTHGTAVDEESVTLDFSAGNQTVKPTDADMMKSAVIQKPEGLAPENIKKGVEIAGIAGEMVGTGVTKEVDLDDLDFSASDSQTISADEDTLMSEVVLLKPKELVPEILPIGTTIAGISGTRQEFDFTDENLQYFTYQIDPENKTILLFSIIYEKLYEKTGSYNVSIPSKIGSYDVIIAPT